jgi:hypothetical protein
VDGGERRDMGPEENVKGAGKFLSKEVKGVALIQIIARMPYSMC